MSILIALATLGIIFLSLAGCNSVQEESFSLEGRTLTAIRASSDRSFFHELWFTEQTYRWNWGERRMLPDSTWLLLQTGWEIGTYQLIQGERAISTLAGTSLIKGSFLWFYTQKGSNPIYNEVSYTSAFTHEGNFYTFFGLNWHEEGAIPKPTIHQSGILRSE